MRTSFAFVVCGCCWLAGCVNMAEKRVVTAFDKSMKEHDAEEMKEYSSKKFEEQAINGDATFEEIRALNLPQGRPKVRKVVDKKNDKDEVTEKLATVEIRRHNSDGKIVGRTKEWWLLKPDDDGKLVVDDIFLTKDQKDGRSVAVRLAARYATKEAVEAWRQADRERILAGATPEFSQVLSELDPLQLQRFARQVTTEIADRVQIMSKERIGDETAELQVAKGTEGELLLKFRKLDGRWKLDDLAVVPRQAHGDKEIESARLVSSAMSAAHAFCEAYRRGDKDRLEQVTTEHFFRGSLASADLAQIELPGTTDGNEDFKVRMEGNSATFVVTTGKEVLKLSLARGQIKEFHTTPQYLIEDVTIYELDGSQDKRLSALFTGQATIAAFIAGMQAQDLATLRACSSHDFNERVWAHARDTEDNNHMPYLPLMNLQQEKLHIVQTLFKGSMSEVHMDCGDQPLTFVLRDEGGRMLVDDLLTPAASRSESLKVNLEVALPVIRFAFGLEQSDMADVRGIVTDDFARSNWNYYRATPEFDIDPLPALKAPLRVVKVDGPRAVLLLGNKRSGAEVVLKREKGEFRVAEATLISGPESHQRANLKKIMHDPLVDRPPSVADLLQFEPAEELSASRK